jgi:hypothetical protein
MLSSRKELQIFEKMATELAAFVRADSPDMRWCHSATAALKKLLRFDGFHDARVLKCSVLTKGSEANLSGLLHQDPNEEAPHSVVIVSGFLIDPTSGQFCRDGVRIPFQPGSLSPRFNHLLRAPIVVSLSPCWAFCVCYSMNSIQSRNEQQRIGATEK